MLTSSTAKPPLSRRAKKPPLEQLGLPGFFVLSSVIFLFLVLFFRVDYGGVLRWRRVFNGPGLERGCDLFDGEWVWDEKYPLYESRDCGLMDQGFRCLENGRPDGFYCWGPA